MQYDGKSASRCAAKAVAGGYAMLPYGFSSSELLELSELWAFADCVPK